MASSSIRLVVFGVLVVGLAAQGFGQGGATGAISGTVQDPTLALIPGVSVRATNLETGFFECILELTLPRGRMADV